MAAAAVALGCQRQARLAVELAVELAVALWSARSLLGRRRVVGVVLWNHLCFYCGNSVVSETPTPLVLQLRQRRSLVVGVVVPTEIAVCCGNVVSLDAFAKG